MTKRGKPTKAQLEAEASYQALLKKWASVPKFARLTPKAVPAQREPVAERPIKPASLVTPGGSTPLKQAQVYTGTQMIGVAQMHKSNAVPIFNSEAAVEVTQMRRS